MASGGQGPICSTLSVLGPLMTEWFRSGCPAGWGLPRCLLPGFLLLPPLGASAPGPGGASGASVHAEAVAWDLVGA